MARRTPRPTLHPRLVRRLLELQRAEPRLWRALTGLIAAVHVDVCLKKGGDQ